MTETNKDLRRYSEQMEAALHGLPLGFVMLDDDQRIVLINQRYFELHRLDPGVFREGMSFRDLLVRLKEAGSFKGDPDSRARQVAELQKNAGATLEDVVTVGEDRVVHIRWSRLPGGGWMATHEDITEQRSAAAERDRSRQFLRFVIDSIPISVRVKDEQGRHLLVNKRFTETFGRTYEEVIGKTADDILPPDRAKRQRMLDAEAWEADGPIVRQVVQGEGDRFGARHLEFRRQVVRGDDGARYLICSVENITERRQAEADRDRSQQFLRFVIDSIPIAVRVKDEQGRYLLVNKRYEELFDRPFDEIVGRTAREIRPPDRAKRQEQFDAEAWAANGPVARHVVQIQKEGRGTQHLEFQRHVVRGDDRTRYLICAIEDVTERRQAETDRDRSQQFLRFVLDNIPTSVWVKDAQGRFLLVNKRYEEAFGHTAEEICGKQSRDFLPADLAAQHELLDTEALKSDTPVVRDVTRVYDDDRGLRYLHVRRRMVRGDDGCEYLIGAIEDVTERRKAELERDRGRQFTQFVIDHIPISIWVKDRAGRYVLVNKFYEQVLGNSFETIRGKTATDFLPPEVAANQAKLDIEAWEADDAVTREVIRDDHRGLRYLQSTRRAVSGDDGVGYLICAVENITERRQAEIERDRSQEFLRFVLDNIPSSVSVKDAQGRFLLINKRFEEVFGNSAEVVRGKTAKELLAPEVAEEQVAMDAAAWAADSPVTQHIVRSNLARPGQFYLEATRHAVRAADGTPYLICAVDDITERRQAEMERDRSQEFLRFVLDNVPTGIWVKDAEGHYLLVNKGYERIFGRPAEAVQGKTVHDVFPKDIADGMAERDRTAIAAYEAGREDAAVTLHHPNDESRYLTAWRHAVRGENGEHYLICVLEDVTERRRKDEQIVHMANYDALTDLPNRSLFRARLGEALADLRPDETIAVLYLDLDHFKTANDSLGHAVGDELLAAVAERLRQSVRTIDVVSRLGGDEFALMLRPRGEDDLDAATAARRILTKLREPFELHEHRLSIDASIGIAMAPEDGTGADALLRNADLALYKAKGDGRGTYCFYDPKMRAEVVARQWLEQDLRAALHNGEFVLHYQPIVDLRRNRVAAVEALLRWRHPTKGLLAPSEFIQIAEDTRLIIPIGEWVFEQACRDVAMLPGDVRIAVNFSQAQFSAKNLVSRINRILRDHKLTPDRFELEITESHLVADQPAAYRRIVRLHDMGFKIAIDDFGTGYSSLHNLASYPFSKIKIDKVFIQQVTKSGNDRKIAETVIGLGAALGMTVTAEGVETDEQLRLLRNLGCTEVQGFAIGMPQTIDKIAELVAGEERRLAGAG